MTWRDEAACAGMDTNIFFPETAEGVKAAQKICGRCPVRAECLALSLTLPRDTTPGVWGGVSHKKRIRMIRNNRRSAA